MTLTYCWDLSAADWIAHSDLRWSQLVGFGPASFEAYARLRFLPDPVRPGQSENDALGQVTPGHVEKHTSPGEARPVGDFDRRHRPRPGPVGAPRSKLDGSSRSVCTP